jgi:peptidoglycan/xylan/chitin deacetylase (PgdA/CDA1 family)
MTDRAISVTVDVEDWYHIPSVTGSPFSRYPDVDHFFRAWGNRRYDYLTIPTYRVLDMLHERGIKATFFVVADVVEHYPGLVQAIAADGHEIACHGLHHACKIDPKTKRPLVTPEEFERRTREARSILEEASGRKVVGYRAPSAYVAGWMLDVLEKIGFRYDSSICANSLYNKTDSGLDGISTASYCPEPGRLTPANGHGRMALVEYPWPRLEVAGVKLPAAGGPMLRFLGAGYIKAGLRQSLGRGGSLFYFHPIDISSEKFPGGFSVKRPFYWWIKGSVVEKRINGILDTYNDEFIELYKRKNL